MEAKEALTIDVTRDGVILIDGTRTNIREFKTLAKTLTGNRPGRGVYLRADQNVNYGIVVQIIAILSDVGVTNVGFMTEPEEVR